MYNIAPENLKACSNMSEIKNIPQKKTCIWPNVPYVQCLKIRQNFKNNQSGPIVGMQGTTVHIHLFTLCVADPFIIMCVVPLENIRTWPNVHIFQLSKMQKI